MKRLRAVLVLAVFAAVPVLPAVGQAEGPVRPDITCRYIESGMDGFEGNVLRIDVLAQSAVIIHRNGEEIQVFTDQGVYFWHEGSRSGTLVDCDGRQATVHNIDRIAIHTEQVWGGRWDTQLVVNQSGGALPAGADDGKPNDPDPGLPGGPIGPGATPESGRSEIEIGVYGQVRRNPATDRDQIVVVGTQQDDRIFVGNKRTIPTVSFHSPEGEDPDPDIWPMPVVADLFVEAAGGDDVVNGHGEASIGLGRPLLPLDDSVHLWIDGGPGNDRLIGSPNRDSILGGPGNDLIRGMEGNDGDYYGYRILAGGKGADRVYGGPGDDNFGDDQGRDRTFGGPGSDRLIGGADGFADYVDCGPGKDRETQRDRRLDRLRNCERIG